MLSAMASAIVTTLSARWAFATPRIIQKGKEVIQKGKEVVKTGKDTYKAAEEAQEAVNKWSAHTKAFINDLSPLDLIGGSSWQQGLFMWMVMACVTLHVVRNWDKKDFRGLGLGYVAGLLAGLGLKYLRGAPIEGAETFVYTALGLAAVTLVVLIVWTGTPFFDNLNIARGEGAVIRFLLRRKLPKSTIPDQPEEDEDEDQSEEGDAEEGSQKVDEGGESASETPESESEPESATVAPPVHGCPQCGRPLEPDARFCGFCPPLVQVQLVKNPTVVCSCGHETEANANLCGFCSKPLRQTGPKGPAEPPTRIAGESLGLKAWDDTF